MRISIAKYLMLILFYFSILILLPTDLLYSQNTTKTFLYDEHESVPRTHNIDITNIFIDVSFEPLQGMVKGSVSHTFIPIQPNVDSVFFDAPSIIIKSANINGSPIKFKQSVTGVSIHPSVSFTIDQSYLLKFEYEATPRLGLYFIGWNDSLNQSRKQIWTQGQAYDNRYWVPLFDKQNDKATTEVKVRFDAQYKVLSNGEKLLEKDNKDGTKTWHYKLSKPHSPYLIMLGIGKYEIKSLKSKGGVPIDLWYYPEYPERVSPTYIYSAEMMDWFEKELMVKYPWGRYAQIPVQDYTFGAMENTSATLFGDFYLVDERSYLDRPYLYVNAHELTHQWFGDLVTERTETHHWLHENFATYYGNLFTGSVKGMDYYDWSRKTAIDQSLEASKKDLLPIAHSKAGTVRHYPKGAVVLDMLRYVAGDESFRRTMKYFLEKHAYQNVDSEDLLIAFHEKTGLSLDWFWEQWIYRGGEPRYDVSFKELNDNKGKRISEFTITQTHETNELVKLFTMPIVVEVHYKNGTKASQRVTISEYRQIISIPNPSNQDIDFVLFDPNMKIIKSVKFEKTFEILAAQAQRAPNMLDRYEALVALRAYSVNEKLDVLLATFNKETFHATKAEIISQLIDSDNSDAIALIRKALSDADADVRRAVVVNTKKVNQSLLFEYERLLADKSYGVIEITLDKLCSYFPEKSEDYLRATYNITGTRGNNIRLKWLEIKVQKDINTYGKQVSVYAGRSYEFITRVGAMNLMKKLNYLDETGVKNIFDCALNANNKLSSDGVALIKHFSGQLVLKKMIDSYYQSKTWQPWQKTILSKAGL
ncbi:MAG: hypothetical protein EAZ07_05440 [Cytophagales bacterium]|nr:MAG: hypothetical protein EAZ07_05440 [Cytophagales bacterium]